MTTDQQIRALQRKVFGEILYLCADAGDKVLTVHSRRAATDVITAIGDRFRGHVILHWFSGTQKELERAQAFGFYFSVNPTMTSSRSGQALIRGMDPARVLTETDGPFVRLKDVPAKPWQAVECLPFLAATWRSTPSEVARRINENFEIISRRVEDADRGSL